MIDFDKKTYSPLYIDGITTRDRFKSLYKVNNKTGCWDWMGRLDPKGYGSFSIGYSNMRAHRASYMMFIGEIGRKIICHKCDNPSCVNPDHLFKGTQSDNCIDSRNKKRGRNSRKTHCKRGHEFNRANTYYDKKGHRSCRACRRIETIGSSKKPKKYKGKRYWL